MHRPLFALSFGIGALILATGHAFAQGRTCAPHEVVVQRLAEGYGETRQAMGVTDANAVVEIFASAETRSWTITVTLPGGPTCLVAAGQGYRALEETLPPAGAPA